MRRHWGKSTLIDLYECDAQMIRDENALRVFVRDLCDLVLTMTRHGETILERFGKEGNEGYTFVQFIEESHIAGHCVEAENSIYLDIFSCGEYSSLTVFAFAQRYFKTKKGEFTWRYRFCEA